MGEKWGNLYERLEENEDEHCEKQNRVEAEAYPQRPHGVLRRE